MSCRIVALEPNASLTCPPGLEAVVDWQLLGLATTSGRAELQVCRNPEASSLREGPIPLQEPVEVRSIATISLADLVRQLGGSGLDLLKLDIEGSEIEVLSHSAPELLRSIGQITVEFHSFLRGDGELRAVADVSRRLQSLGFQKLDATAPAGHETDTLFLNVERLALPLRVRAYLRFGEPLITAMRSAGGAVRRLLRRGRGANG